MSTKETNNELEKENLPFEEENKEAISEEKNADNETDEVVDNLKKIDTIPLNEPKVEKRINQKPHLMMRTMGAVVDLCLILMGAIGLMQIIYNTGISSPYHEYVNQMRTISDEAKLTSGVGKKLYTTDPNYGNYTSYIVHGDATGNYIVVNNDNYTEEQTNHYTYILKNNVTYVNDQLMVEMLDYAYTVTAAAISEFVFVLLIPLVNKRRATIGKFAAGTMLIHRKTESYAKWWQALVRYLWIFGIETAIPLLILNYVAAAFIVPIIVFLFMLISRKENRTLHDLVSG
ncbi:MAG: RDD family protein, partial [Bacilli bacterium]|nr:RDD family protein [Bacilli bacterium]